MKSSRNIIVIGPSGAGKTHIVRALRDKLAGIYDADNVKVLGKWWEGNRKVDFPHEADAAWLSQHEYLWDKKVLEDFVRQHQPITLFGLSGNCFDVLDLFDEAVFLEVPKKVILERLQHETRNNPFGRTKDQQDAVAEYHGEITEKAKELGLRFVDANRSPEEIIKDILK